MTIKQQRVCGYASAREAIQDALRLEGLPRKRRERIGFNGAVPGDGISLGSITAPCGDYGGVTVYRRIHTWGDLKDIVNDADERRRFAAWAA